MEDAAFLRPESGSPLVFTVDFITPIVDSPEDFGAIAAANALSDVYAMGGEPQVALAVCGFPGDELPNEILTRIFCGGRDKAAEAGCAIVGGHTVLDPELKYGLCVIGTVDPDRVLSQVRAQPGDRLVLTKPIGFGIAAQAIKQDRLTGADHRVVVDAMKTLNRAGRDAALAAGATGATDVTGFGLMGHLHNLAMGAGCGARIFADAVPSFGFVREFIAEGLVPGGSRKNLDFVAPVTRFADAVSEVDRLLLADAQTSGGLLIAVPPDREERLVGELEQRGALARSVIGEMIAGEPGHLQVEAGTAR
jgi:selenide,water dikinase